MARAQVQGRHRFEAGPGDRILLLGRNGSGKTSILRALAGLRPWIPVAARWETPAEAWSDPQELDARALASHATCTWQAPRDALVGLTVDGEFRMRRRTAAPTWQDRAHREVARLSSGEARTLSLDVLADVPLTLLDEPMEGLDHVHEVALRHLILERSDAGAVVFCDHTGRLHDLATHIVHLDPTPATDLPTVPHAAGPPCLERPASVHESRRVPLPALRLGPGLHALTGPNASGKSTFLETLAGLHPDRRDRPDRQTPDLPKRSRPGPAPRAPRLLLPEAADQLVHDTVREELAAADPTIVARFVPAQLRHRHPLALSGGEARRVGLAKVLGSDAKVLLLDEPEAHLDAAGRHALWTTFAEHVQNGRCILVATHDPQLIAAAQTTVRMDTP